MVKLEEITLKEVKYLKHAVFRKVTVVTIIAEKYKILLY